MFLHSSVAEVVLKLRTHRKLSKWGSHIRLYETRYATGGLLSPNVKRRSSIQLRFLLYWVILFSFLKAFALMFDFLAIWQYQSSQKRLPAGPQDTEELQTIADTLVSGADVNKQVLTALPSSLIEWVRITSDVDDIHDFMTSFSKIRSSDSCTWIFTCMCHSWRHVSPGYPQDACSAWTTYR